MQALMLLRLLLLLLNAGHTDKYINAAQFKLKRENTDFKMHLMQHGNPVIAQPGDSC